MKSPFTGGKITLISENRKAIFRKEEYEYTHLCYQCEDTKEIFTTTQIDTFNTLQVYNSYRQAYNIPYPDEIKDTRKKYKLSAFKMSKILGFGDNQYRLYENGEIPNIGNGKVLRTIQSPQTFESFVDASRNIITDEEYKKIKANIEECKSKSPYEEYMHNLIFKNYCRNRYNGYAKSSISKLKNVMLYYIEKFNGLYVTQMNKILFYTDFLSFREDGQAITGLSYIAIQYGPVPCQWQKIYSLIEDIYQSQTEDNKGSIITSNISCDKSSLTAEELTILERVYNTFKTDNSNSISKKSHNEPAWIDNQATHSLIDFKYAFSLVTI